MKRRKVTVDQFIEQCNQIGVDPAEAVSRMQERLEAKEMGKESAPAGGPELRRKIIEAILESGLSAVDAVNELNDLQEAILRIAVEEAKKVPLQVVVSRLQFGD